MECKETSLFKYKRMINVEKWFDWLYDGNFGMHHFILSNNERGVIHIHNAETKEHIASLVRSVLYTNDLNLCK